MVEKQRSKLMQIDSIMLTCWDNAVITVGYHYKRSKTKLIICISDRYTNMYSHL